MELKDINPADIDQMKSRLDGDLTVTIALIMKNGSLEILNSVPAIEARSFADKVEVARRSASETIHTPLDPAENEPGPPLAQNPCQSCGLVHPATGNITCVCQFCGEIRELVHSGACEGCCRHRFGHYFEQMGTPLGDVYPEKPPWAN